ncbi:MAG: hypothetical protein A2V84_00925 [Chloroflexi bacterium RBG_16_70_13]|nr:MAG: hypothetical protein A2V84_00925 [Chloroflexi bacterium RBG_16_70_13]
MEQTTKQAARPNRRTIIVALVVGLAVLLLLFPGSGNSAQPPTCYSMFGYVVPCDAWVSWAAGVATAGLVGLGLWMNERRRG